MISMTCTGSGSLDTFTNAAVVRRSNATGKAAAARVNCPDCAYTGTGRVVSRSHGIALSTPMVTVPTHNPR